MGDQPNARPLPTHRTTQHKNANTSMPGVGFKPMIPVFEQPKTVCVSHQSAVGTGQNLISYSKISRKIKLVILIFKIKYQLYIWVICILYMFCCHMNMAVPVFVTSDPPSLLSSGYRGALPLGVERPGREADHSPPSNAMSRMHGAMPPWHGAQLKHRDNFAIYQWLVIAFKLPLMNYSVIGCRYIL